MKYRKEYIIGLISGIIYTIIENKSQFEFFDFLGKLVGAMLIPVIISFLISIFSKNYEFGKNFGIISIVIHVMGILGQLKS